MKECRMRSPFFYARSVNSQVHHNPFLESSVFEANPETLSTPTDYHSGLQDGCIVKAFPELLEKLVLSFVANLWGALTQVI